MKTIRLFSLVLIFSSALLSCKNDKVVKNTETTENTKTIAANPKTTSFEIEGMTCALGCASLIEGKLNKLDGITEAKVDFETKTATVTYDADKLNQEKITETVEAVAGGELYKVSKVKS
jgi:copper chaperone CopZ